MLGIVKMTVGVGGFHHRSAKGIGDEVHLFYECIDGSLRFFFVGHGSVFFGGSVDVEAAEVFGNNVGSVIMSLKISCVKHIR